MPSAAQRLDHASARLRPLLAAVLAAILSAGLAAPPAAAATASESDLAADLDPAGFAAWRDDFAERLRAEGVEAGVVAAMLDGLQPAMEIVERDRTQPEFVRPVWEYLAGAASDRRTEAGRAAQAEHAGVLSAVEARFGVDADILTAIWGLESAYGVIQGDHDIVRGLATLAWEGRRRAWAEGQLRAVATMLERGYATRDDLKGSWAGAMGQTQFIPATYLMRAVDFDGDGRRDIWASEADALGSAANLLAEAGWSPGAPVVAEVALPAAFDFAAWDERRRRPVADWALAGVAPADGEGFDARQMNSRARLLLPAGADGPAFLAFENFDVLMAYNNSTSYALGVSYLARRLEGGAGAPGGWPEGDPPITRSQTLALQRALIDLGYDPGGADGIAGPNTRRALKAFQADRGLPADGYAGRRAYERVMAEAG